ncbi:MAG: GNAT family N-acetyltransferase [Cruoricaptor ignavus]|nr:GNAT family N-acetyltransferase [Cruoricaptor ignavus]
MIDVTQTNTPTNGKFEIFADDVPAGELLYSWIDEQTFAIEHTEVFDGFNGKGYGKELLFAVAEYARDNGKKIVPVCSYAKNSFEINPNIADVLK